MANSTTVVVPGHDDYTLPGTLSIAQAKAMLSSEIPAINSMDATESTAGGTKTITFSNRSGTKG